MLNTGALRFENEGDSITDAVAAWRLVRSSPLLRRQALIRRGTAGEPMPELAADETLLTWERFARGARMRHEIAVLWRLKFWTGEGYEKK